MDVIQDYVFFPIKIDFTLFVSECLTLTNYHLKILILFLVVTGFPTDQSAVPFKTLGEIPMWVLIT